jgi:uncharacterized protein
VAPFGAKAQLCGARALDSAVLGVLSRIVWRILMKPLYVLFAVLILAGLAAGEDKPLVKIVRVTGTAEVKVVPDRAAIELGVEKQSPSASVAKQLADTATRRILAVLRSHGVDEKDIQTTFLSLRPQYDYRKGMQLSHFVSEQTVSVTVRDLAKLDSLLEELIKVGGNRIYSLQYETSDLRKYRDQARDFAVKAAREKAQALAHALGQEIGKAQAIEEVSDAGGQYSALSNYSYESKQRDTRAGSATAAGQTTISASIVVSFELD